ncbi:MAG: ABC transporter permease subunit [Blautia wexlerae]
MVRNEYISLKQETYVKVCEAFGISKSNIMFKQILPNVKSPIIVSITTNVAAFILSEAGISFYWFGNCRQYTYLGKYFKYCKSSIRGNKSVVDMVIPRIGNQFIFTCN